MHKQISLLVSVAVAPLLNMVTPSIASAQVAAGPTTIPPDPKSAPISDPAVTPPGVKPAPAAQAAQPVNQGIGEIVVTAQRRAQNLQKVASAINVLSGEEVAKQNIVNITDLTKAVPGFNANAGSAYTNISMRGVYSSVSNSFGDPAIATNVDQVNLARASSAVGLFYDLQRIEVLKGPQGTLYGRNATGGAVNVLTNIPKLNDFRGNASVAFGNYAAITTEGAVNVPLGQLSAMRFAFQTVNHDGYFSDGTGDENRKSGRLSFRTDPVDGLTIVLRGDYTKVGGKGPGGTALNYDGSFFRAPFTSIVDSSPEAIPVFAPYGCPFGTFKPCIPQAHVQYQNNHFWGLNGTADWHVVSGTATLVVSYREDKLDFINGASGQNFAEKNKATQFSMEGRFASDPSKRLSYVAGLFYIKTTQKGSADYDGQYAGINPSQLYHLGGDSWAAFGQASFKVLDTLRLTGGLRYTKETKSIDARTDVLAPYYRIGVDPMPARGAPSVALNDVANWSAVNYRAGVEWDVAPRSMLYANVSTGFKSGGFFVNQTTDPLGATYNPEHVTAYAIGAKNRFLDNKLQINVEAFYLNYTNQQVGAANFNSMGISIFPTYNVGGSRIKGVDLEARLIVARNTTFALLGQYGDAVYRDFNFSSALSNAAPPAAQTACPVSNPVRINAGFTAYTIDCSGKPSLQTPKWSFNASVEQVFPLANGAQIVASARTFYETKRYTALTFLPYTIAPGGFRSGADLTYRKDRLEVAAFIDNIENRASIMTGAKSSGNILQPEALLRPPRTYGVRVNVEF